MSEKNAMSTINSNKTAPETLTITTTAEDVGQRLDKVIASHADGISRALVQKLMKAGHLQHDGAAITDGKHKVEDDQTYTLTLPESKPTSMEPANIPLDIVYEDNDLLVINKQAGLTVHPGAGTGDDTLVHALLYHCGDSLSNIGGEDRPGIVHRLDRDTSGLMVVAKNDATHRALAEQLEAREISRTYHAYIWGVPTPSAGTIRTLIDRDNRDRTKMAVHQKKGRNAVTHYRVIERYGHGLASLVECKLETGRTHQIRVHMAYLGHPIIGDSTYSRGHNPKIPKELKGLDISAIHNAPRHMLHACSIAFEHPKSAEMMQFSCNHPSPTTEDINSVIEHLKNL